MTVFSQGDCDITDLIAEPTVCENGMFFVDIDFNVVNPQGDTFGIVGNSTDYGFFEYDSLPVTLGPLEGDDVTVWEFIVYDLNEPNCQETYVLGVVNCCSITDVMVDPNDCTNNDVYSATVNFNFSNTGNVGFDVFDENGNLLGFFPYTDLPVTVENIPSNGIGSPDVLVICDNDDLSCCTEVVFEGPDCDPDDCEIYNVIAIPGDCENGDFFVQIDFDFVNTGPGFTITGNGNDYGAFDYDSLPVTIGPLTGDGITVYEFVVTDVQTDGCSNFTVIDPVDCPPGCGFDEVNIDPIECQGDSNYSLGLNFIPVNPVSASFVVSSQGVDIGTFAYDDLPIVIDSFPASGNFFDIITISDSMDSMCTATFEFQALLCEGCIIYDLVVEQTPCDSNGQFFVDIDFQFQNTSDTFQVGGNGNTYGLFSYDDLPITLGPFAGDSMTFYEFVVADLNSAFCLAGFELGIVDCISPCTIFDLAADPLECTGPGTYDLIIDFEVTNPMNGLFDVYANGNFLDFYSLSDLPVIVEDFPASGNDNDVITVCINDNPDCCATLEFPSPACACSINELLVDVDECLNDSTFGAFINFNYSGFASDAIDVFANGEFIAFVEFDTLPVYVEGLPATGNGINVMVCANDLPDCCAMAEVLAPVCDTEACNIFDIVVDPDVCTDNGTFSATINFEYTNLTSTFVNVTIDGEFYGEFAADSFPLSIDSIPGDGTNSLITICDNDDPECCGSHEFETLNCDTADCAIFDIVVDPVECADDGTFFAFVNFEYTGLAGSFVNMTVGDTDLGTYHVDSLPVLVDGIPGDGGNAVITICSNDAPDCCGILEFTTLDCDTAECDIFEIVVDPDECAGDGTFSATINFGYTNLTSAFVNVTIDGEFFGEFAADSFPLTIDGIPGDGTNSLITICDNDNPECCGLLEFQTLDCDTATCSISDLAVTVLDCDTVGVFSLLVNFNHDGLTNDFVEIWSGETFLGFFAYDPLPIFIDGVPATDSMETLTVCENDNPDCCTMIQYMTPNCDSAVVCDIFNIEVSPTVCDSIDGTFSATVTYDHVGLTNDFVEMWSGDVYLGLFAVDSMPHTVSGIPGDGENAPFTICQNDNDDCCTTVEIETLDCGFGDCEINELMVEISECDTAGQFTVSITFLFSNVGMGGFSIIGNGTNYGTFSYDSLPVTLGPFQGDTTPWEFAVIDNDQPSCNNAVGLGIVNCDPSAVNTPGAVRPLEVLLGNGQVRFIVPESVHSMAVWTIDGKQVLLERNLSPGETIILADLPAAGLYIVQLSGDNGVYIGKAFLTN